jgi:hypothetical protein
MTKHETKAKRLERYNAEEKEREKENRYKPKRPTTLPARWEPKFLTKLDGRPAHIRTLKKRISRLMDDAGIESFQKEMLAERAVFMAARLETLEVKAMRGEEIDFGSYTQSVNCFIGLMKSIGLERKIRQVANLRDYVDAQKVRKKRKRKRTKRTLKGLE